MQILTKYGDFKLKKITIKNIYCEPFLHLYISYNIDFIKLIFNKNIYIVINNISIFERKFYPKDIFNIISIFDLAQRK